LCNTLRALDFSLSRIPPVLNGLHPMSFSTVSQTRLFPASVGAAVTAGVKHRSDVF
jgi:hypothetical protein